jgi:uncharacterized protein (TIGR02147 family)
MRPVLKRSIFTYTNYRDFMRDFYATAKAENSKHSFRYFARLAGFKSSSVFKNVMDGKRNIAHYNLDAYAKALQLNKEETYYFRNLVLLNQAETIEEKQEYAKAILRSRLYKVIHPLGAAQYHFYAQWYWAVIWEFASLPGFKQDPQWIAEHLSPTVTTSEVKRALDELLKLGLLQRDTDGKIRKATGNLATSDEVASTAIAQWHREMLNRASESISRVPREKRDVSSITFAMSSDMAAKVKEKIQKFRKEIVEMQKVSEQGADMVYQLNLQFFPHIEIEKDDVK